MPGTCLSVGLAGITISFKRHTEPGSFDSYKLRRSINYIMRCLVFARCYLTSHRRQWQFLTITSDAQIAVVRSGQLSSFRGPRSSTGKLSGGPEAR